MSKQNGGVKIEDDEGDTIRIDESDSEEPNVGSDNDTTESNSDETETEEIDELSEEDVAEIPSKFDVDEQQTDESCLYTVNSKFSSNALESDFMDTIVFDDDKIVQTTKIVDPNDRITKPFLTKYERVRLLSDRVQQLVNGSKPMIKTEDLYDERQIAELELQRKVIPLIVVRTLPNGTIEHWKLSELEIIN